MSSLGWISVVALMLSFFFMSIMYPTHFALAIRGLGERTKLAASWMVTAVVGGAILPYFMGRLADNYSMRVGFLMPLMLLLLHRVLRFLLAEMVCGTTWSRRRLATHELPPTISEQSSDAGGGTWYRI